MSRDTLNFPTARTWRDIPQPVVPRAMSAEGRWRLTLATLRIAGLVLACGLFAWGVRLVYSSLNHSDAAPTTNTRSTPMKAAELRTDGVLDGAWLARTLALPARASLMDLDLVKLQGKLLADRQVVTATLTRNFPDRLIVQISERTPVARVKIELAGEQRTLVVARDGTIYPGSGYDAAMLETLPWLDGVTIAPDGAGFRPIEGMEVAAELLAKARLEAEHLYNTWGVISLKRLAKDQILEVRTKNDACTVYFTARDDFFRQLAKLDYIATQLASAAVVKAKIDLSLSPDVPVTVELDPTKETVGTGRPATLPGPTRSAAEMPVRIAWPRATAATPKAEHAFFFHPQPSKTQREL